MTCGQSHFKIDFFDLRNILSSAIKKETWSHPARTGLAITSYPQETLNLHFSPRKFSVSSSPERSMLIRPLLWSQNGLQIGEKIHTHHHREPAHINEASQSGFVQSIYIYICVCAFVCWLAFLFVYSFFSFFNFFLFLFFWFFNKSSQNLNLNFIKMFILSRNKL